VVDDPIVRQKLIYLEAPMSVTTHDIVSGCHGYGRAVSDRPAGLGEWLSRVVRTWRERIRERDAFARLDDRDLRDLGLSRWQVESEVVKPFWRS